MEFQGFFQENPGISHEVSVTAQCNIGCKTLFAERGKMPLELTETLAHGNSSESFR